MSRYLLVPVDGGSNESVILPKDIFKNYGNGICCTSDGLVQCGEEKFDIKFDDFVKDRRKFSPEFDCIYSRFIQ